MPAKNETVRKKKSFSGQTVIVQVADFVDEVLTEGKATQIVIEDDRGGQGVINVYVVKPKE